MREAYPQLVTNMFWSDTLLHKFMQILAELKVYAYGRSGTIMQYRCVMEFYWLLSANQCYTLNVTSTYDVIRSKANIVSCHGGLLDFFTETE